MAQRVKPLSRDKAILLLCDMQEKFRPTIKYFPQIVETSNKLLQACKILDIPYVVTEQYPKGNSITLTYKVYSILFLIGLGRTVSELDIGDTKPFEKTLFSMCTSEVLSHIKEQVKGRNNKNSNFIIDLLIIFRFQYCYYLRY